MHEMSLAMAAIDLAAEQAKLVAERVHARIREPLTLAALNTPIERAAMACLADRKSVV